ncbi:SusC/RagA family TonB-linked outer membrane protein [Microbacter margulisiae]|uniref:TonB-linked SusC/RagA family outer membrane protein n=1 Tax=Microbacter margulisiae TaxID=1350067 RepID=A0A7W5H2U0_9PORP|nr:TonB-dependent receptor [Microbacter margulisiae]MBB3187727.1 TonB-linked SusC/RagA family outer membrane protein [Microbacter margulisiae]
MKRTTKGGRGTTIPLPKQMKRALMLLLFIAFGTGAGVYAVNTNAASAQTDQSQAEKTVSGKVVDKSGNPLPGVTVVVKGTTKGTITDANGVFRLNQVPENGTLQFSFVGMKTQDVSVHNRLSVNITMEDEAIGLNEVVAIGYGVQQKKVMTGATVQVTGNDIQKLNTVSTLGALQGSTPGVQLTKSDGQPGDSYKIDIRGMGTIGNAIPLYVVDGVVVGSIDNLSPSDIQSVDVLKDATAAIYGSRAANGVILITTKQGKTDEKPTITYDGYYGWQNVYKTANTLNAQQYLTIINEGMVNSGQMPYDITKLATSLNGNDYGAQVPLVPNAAAILAGTNKGTNWMQAITNDNAPIQNHSLNLTGGSAKSTYSFGLSYMSQDGILGKPVASHFDRYNLRMNSDHKIITNSNRAIWKIGENINYSFNEKSGIAVSNGYWNDIYDMESANPFLPIYGAKGLYSYPIPWDHLQNNPIATMIYTRGLNSSKNHNLTASFYTTVSPIKGLELTSRFSTNVSAGSYRSFQPTYDLGSVSTSTTAVGNSVNNTSQSMYVGLNWMWDNTITYNFKINQEHNFTILAGESAERDNLGESMNASNQNNIFNSFEYAYLSNTPTISSTGGTVVGGSSWGGGGILSYFGRLNYDYKGTYLFSAVVRDDGSSNFAAGHRWGTFPAFSAGWIITNESFMKNTQSWLDFLKIRASWGKNGNQAIPNFNYLSTIQTGGVGAGNYYTFGDKTAQSAGAYPNIIPNPNVTWETSTQTDIGFDANLFNSRLTLNFDWYNKATDNWLVQAPVQAVYGTNAPYINGGNILNRGYEINLGWKDHIGQFQYNISGNISFNHNEVTKIEGGVPIYGQKGFYGNNSYWYVAKVGMPAGCFYGYKTNGIFQTEADVLAYKNKNGGLIMPNAVPGDIRFVDINGDGKIDNSDMTNIGNPHAPYTYGVTIALSYQGFDFSFLGTGVSGNKIIQATDWNSLNDPLANYTTGILNRWHGPGTSNTMPRVSLNGNNNNNYLSDMWLQSGDYFRISNLTLGYDFKHIWKSMPLQQARLYATIQNAYTFTKYRGMDPEVGYAPDSWSQGIDIGYYPSPRTVMIGVDLKF